MGLPGGVCSKKRHVHPTQVPPNTRKGGEACGRGAEAGYGKCGGATGVAAVGSVGADARRGKLGERGVAPCRSCRHEVREGDEHHFTAVRSIKHTARRVLTIRVSSGLIFLAPPPLTF